MAYPVHELAKLFPPGTEDELKKLASHIKENGLLEPVVLHDGLVLDGRRRQEACGLAKVEPRYVQWAGECGTPTQFVLAKNFHRRHLTTAEKALIAAKAMDLLKAEAAARQEASRAKPGEKIGSRKKNGDGTAPSAADSAQGESTGTPTLREKGKGEGKAAAQAGKLAGVSTKTVENAATVLNKGTPELQEAVKKGTIGVRPAAQMAKTLTPAEQVEAAKKAASRPRRTGIDPEKNKDQERRAIVKWLKRMIEAGKTIEDAHARVDEMWPVVVDILKNRSRKKKGEEDNDGGDDD